MPFQPGPLATQRLETSRQQTLPNVTQQRQTGLTQTGCRWQNRKSDLPCQNWRELTSSKRGATNSGVLQLLEQRLLQCTQQVQYRLYAGPLSGDGGHSQEPVRRAGQRKLCTDKQGAVSHQEHWARLPRPLDWLRLAVAQHTQPWQHSVYENVDRSGQLDRQRCEDWGWCHAPGPLRRRPERRRGRCRWRISST